MTLGRRIRLKREALGLSQPELGRRAGGITGPEISNYERGIKEPGAVRIKRLAAALEETPESLAGPENIARVKKKPGPDPGRAAGKKPPLADVELDAPLKALRAAVQSDIEERIALLQEYLTPREEMGKISLALGRLVEMLSPAQAGGSQSTETPTKAPAKGRTRKAR